VLAPNSPQEMCDLTMLAFELADRYRNPVVVLSDGFTGQMMEAVEFPEPVTELPAKDWAVRGTPETAGNLINSIRLMPEDLEEHVTALFEKYGRMAATEVRYEEVGTEDAELVVVGYGIVSRLLRAAMARLRARGLRVGMLRPITLWPFPSERLAELAETADAFLVAELSTGQMVEDVRLAVNGRRPVAFHGRYGGAVPSVDELVRAIEAVYPVEATLA
jgi:pyruvate/2-oxoacid:ferredoxin oxidoreductase alpha subunit